VNNSRVQQSAPAIIGSSEVWVRRAIFWGVALVMVVIDQIFKLWVRTNFQVGETQPVIEGWLRWTHSLNTGAAWSMLAGQRWLLVLISIGVSGFILMMAHEFLREPVRRTLPLLGLGMIFGGAIGNLIDRILHGVVTDMIDLDTPIEFLRTFPIFNLADSALTVGVILLAIHFLFVREESPEPKIKDQRSKI